LGKIGLDYDYDIKDRKVILTHSKALYLNRKFKIIAGIDKSSKQLLKFRSKYNIRAFRSIYNFIKFNNNNNKIDLIILSTNTENRLKDFKNILKLKPKVVLIEKPISYNLSDTKKILKDLY
jgi:predicted dehydrogenase